MAAKEDPAYRTFIQDTGNVCWRCGRQPKDRPSWWAAPFLIERAHIDGCNKPRRRDRRTVISMCSLCHRLQHGDRFPQDDRKPLPLIELLRMKRQRDPDYWDREFLQSCSVRLLPAV